MIYTQNISLDVAREQTLYINAKQYDSNSRFLEVTILAQGQPQAVAAGSAVTINARRPDGSAQSFAGTVVGGLVRVPVDSWILEQYGTVYCSISVVDSNTAKITTLSFRLIVERSEGNGWILVYTAPAALSAGTYYITLSGINYQFTTTQTVPIGGKIYFSSTYATGKTVGTSDIETLTLTVGSSGTQLVGSDVINFLASFMAQIADLGNKADKVGESPDLVAGTAEQIIGEEFTENKVPYSFRQTPGSGKRLAEEVVGGTVAWNQLSEDANKQTLTNYTTGSGTLAGTSANSIIGHVYLLLNVVTEFDTPETIAYRFYYNGSSHATSTVSPNVIYKATTDSSKIYYINFASAYHNKTITKMVLSPIAADLTVDFGSTIADYLYTLESNTPGAGVAKFRELFPADYYAYCEPTLQSVCVSEHREYGVNWFDRTAATPDKILAWATGALYNKPKSILSDYVRAIDGITLYSNYKVACYGFDQNKNYLGAWYVDKWVKAMGGEVQSFSPSGAYYYRFAIRTGANGNADMTAADITINISNPLINGKYYPYSVNSYPLDAVELRGVLRLDSDNNIYADGDTYEGDGTVTRKYGILTNQSGAIGDTITLTGAKSNLADLVSTKGHLADIGTISGTTLTLTVALSGDDIVYELATPTTESAAPYPSLQHCSGGGTEEYVDYLVGQGTRDVSIPAGHNSKYYPDLTQRISDIPEPPSGDGTYTLKCTVSSGVRTFAWV